MKGTWSTVGVLLTPAASAVVEQQLYRHKVSARLLVSALIVMVPEAGWEKVFLAIRRGTRKVMAEREGKP